MAMKWFPLEVDLDLLLKLPTSGVNVLFYLMHHFGGNRISYYNYIEVQHDLKYDTRSVYRGFKALENAEIGIRHGTGKWVGMWVWKKCMAVTQNDLRPDGSRKEVEIEIS